MKNAEVVRKFIARGWLLSPETLDRLTDTNLQKFLDAAAARTGLVFSATDEPEVSVKVCNTSLPEKITPKDVLENYMKKYEVIKNMLSRKTDAISINKAKRAGGHVFVIGMVRCMTAAGFTLEDGTDSIDVAVSHPGFHDNTNNPDAVVDDVIGVAGTASNGAITASSIIWPDVSLKHKTGGISGLSIILAARLKPETTASGADFIIIPKADETGLPENVSKKLLTHLSTPSWIMLSKNNEKALILIHRAEKEVQRQEALDFLKKRCLTPAAGQPLADTHIIKNVPDIFWLIQEKEWKEIYKGVTVISAGEMINASINLETKDIRFF